MPFTSRQLVYSVIATRVGISSSLLDDRDSLDALGLHKLDFVLMAAEIGVLSNLRGECPVVTLDRARTVGDLVAFVDNWCAGEESAARRGMQSAVDGRLPRPH